MIVQYNITDLDGAAVATVVADASAQVGEYGALTGIEEAGKVACAFIEATLGGELLFWEEVNSGRWFEIPHSPGWVSGPNLTVPYTFRWAEGYEPMG